MHETSGKRDVMRFLLPCNPKNSLFISVHERCLMSIYHSSCRQEIIPQPPRTLQDSKSWQQLGSQLHMINHKKEYKLCQQRCLRHIPVVNIMIYKKEDDFRVVPCLDNFQAIPRSFSGDG